MVVKNTFVGTIGTATVSFITGSFDSGQQLVLKQEKPSIDCEDSVNCPLAHRKTLAKKTQGECESARKIVVLERQILYESPAHGDNKLCISRSLNVLDE